MINLRKDGRRKEGGCNRGKKEETDKGGKDRNGGETGVRMKEIREKKEGMMEECTGRKKDRGGEEGGRDEGGWMLG